MIASHILQKFIETYVDYIESERYQDLVNCAYEELSNSDISELKDVLNICGVDLLPYMKEEFFMQFHGALYDFRNDSARFLSLISFERLYLHSLCGLSVDQAKDVIMEHAYRFKDEFSFQIDVDGDLYIQKKN